MDIIKSKILIINRLILDNSLPLSLFNQLEILSLNPCIKPTPVSIKVPKRINWKINLKESDPILSNKKLIGIV